MKDCDEILEKAVVDVDCIWARFCSLPEYISVALFWAA
jgi:hypothetical protein